MCSAMQVSVRREDAKYFPILWMCRWRRANKIGNGIAFKQKQNWIELRKNIRGHLQGVSW